MLLRHYLERGVSKTELSRRFGVSSRTIHEWIETGQLDRDLARGGLESYRGSIEARLEEFPRLSAKQLYDEVRTAGYTGGYARVRITVGRCGRGSR